MNATIERSKFFFYINEVKNYKKINIFFKNDQNYTVSKLLFSKENGELRFSLDISGMLYIDKDN